MPSNHTTIAAWVNSKLLYNYINRHAGTSNITSTKGTISLDKVVVVVVVVVVYLTLTDPLRIQPWSQDRRKNQTKPGIRSEKSRESRQKRTDKGVVSKGHCRDQQETENTNKSTTNRRNKQKATRYSAPQQATQER